MFQNAELMYRGTDLMIDTINANPEWGVHAQYATPSEYLAAVRSSPDVEFPVKTSGTNFFPYNDWSGYFTSRSGVHAQYATIIIKMPMPNSCTVLPFSFTVRPTLKGLNTEAHAALNVAEQLFALRGARLDSNVRSELWKRLDDARRQAAIVQHHDAITGTMCSAREGCAGVDQVIGPHNVLEDYERMLADATSQSDLVSVEVLANQLSLPSLSADVGSAFGNILLGNGDGGDDVLVVVYNDLAIERTEGLSLQVPVCAVDVTEYDTEKAVLSQVVAEFSIQEDLPPYYDFRLSFEATIPPLGTKIFRVSPSPDSTCGGGDVEVGKAAFARHESIHPTSVQQCSRSEIDIERETVQRAMARQQELGSSGDLDSWNALLSKVRREVETELSATCEVEDPVAVVLENRFLAVTVTPSFGITSVKDKESGKEYPFTHELLKYETKHGDAYGFAPTGPATPILNASAGALASTAALGPVTQEVWLQISAQLKTRVRIWISNDPQLGRRIELGHKIGVLPPLTEVVSRFTAPALKTDAVFFSEDNGYEKIPHAAGTDGGNIATHLYPSQASVALSTSELQLSVALDRSHAVGSLVAGSIDVVQHRRGTPYTGTGGTVVLDDIDRIFTQTWVALGPKEQANRDRVSMKLRLNHPPRYFFARGGNKTKTIASSTSKGRIRGTNRGERAMGGVGELPDALHLQAVRALGPDPKSDGMLVRLRSMFATGEDSDKSQPQTVDVLGLFSGLPEPPKKAEEVTLSGIMPVSELNRTRYPAVGAGQDQVSDERGDEDELDGETVHAFEMRTWLLS